MRESSMKTLCSVEGCETPSRTRGWCEKHYKRWYKTGSPHIVRAPGRAAKGSLCFVDECETKARVNGMCPKHYARTLRGNDPWEPVVFSGPGSPNWKDRLALSYDTLHERLRRFRGPATEHACVSCGDHAHHWAYQHTDPNPLISRKGLSRGCEYSEDLSCYEAMCRRCHKRLDREWRQNVLRTTEVAG